MGMLNNALFMQYCLEAGRILIGLYFFSFFFWNYYHRVPAIEGMRASHVPFAPVIFGFGICFQLVIGLLVVFAQFTEICAALLVIYVICATFIFHRFWTMEEGAPRTLNTIIFIGNLTVTLGGLLLLIGLSAAVH